MKAALVLVGLFSVLVSCGIIVVHMEPPEGGNSAQYITQGIVSATKQ